MSNIAMVFAGGVGSRMGHPDGPKQFVLVQNKPVIIYTLERFEQDDEIEAIYIACIGTHIDLLWSLIGEYSITKVRKITNGGNSAHESIYNGIRLAYEDYSDKVDTIVLIHDGVRPVITEKIIGENIDSVRKYRSAITSIPAFETVAISHDDGLSVDTIPRRDYMYTLQAPQSFYLQDIVEWNNRADQEGSIGNYIDQAHLVASYGGTLRLINGIRGNIKLTVSQDLDYFNYQVVSGGYAEILSGGKR